jgi:hypothetical protein
MSEKAVKTQVIAYYIQGLAYIVYSPSVSVLRKAVVTVCSLLFYTEQRPSTQDKRNLAKYT